MLWVNKKKALDYFSVSAPLAEAQNNQELISTTKVIQNFENPNIEPQFSTRELDAPYLDAVERGDGINTPEGTILMGLNMLSGLKWNGKEYTGGIIYDPANGKTYYCSMKVENNILKVRGSLDKRGFLGRTMDWFKVK